MGNLPEIKSILSYLILIDVISYVTSNSNKHNISLKRLLISAIARPPYCNNIVNLIYPESMPYLVTFSFGITL